MAKKHYEEWSKEELIREVLALKRQKTYGLVWEREKTKEDFDLFINWEGEKTKEEFSPESKDKFPVLAEVIDKEISTDNEKPVNLLIEGDNYHSLAVLNFTHKNAIDVIYIDPPFNTGNKTWKYNNNYVDKDDGYKHSKWLSFMSKRLSLSKNLLKESGIILVAIDDYELATLKLLMDEIFGEENRMGTIVIIHNPGGRQDENFFATSHEYMLAYARNITNAVVGRLDISETKMSEYRYEDPTGRFKLRDFRRSGANSRKHERPRLWYSIFVDPKTLDVDVEHKKGWFEVKPIDPQGIERVWRWNAKTFMQKKDTYILVKKTNSSYIFYVKERVGDNPGEKPKTVWNKPGYSAVNGTNELKNILHEDFKGHKIFDFPKSPFLLYDILKITTDKNSTIVDFFAGSGTTGQALLKLNADDGGNRKFILCTNNEDNNGDGNKVCSHICYPRLKNVISGYKNTNENLVLGLGGNLKYFKTDFVEAAPTDKNKRKLVEKCTEMLCIKETAFDKVKDGKKWKIFKNKDYKLGIIFDDEYIEDFIKEAEKISGKFNVYVFSHDDSTPTKEFKSIKNRVTLCPIPETILKVYRKVFKND